MLHYPFKVKELEYVYSALEPIIDTRTMSIHHNKLYSSYVDKLNIALMQLPWYHTWTLEKLLRCYNMLPCGVRTAVKNAAGGVSNHEIYFEGLSNMKTNISTKLDNAIKKEFKSFDSFIIQFVKEGSTLFGSGYVCLCSDFNGKLSIKAVKLQDSPYSINLIPLIMIDVWEHSYFIKYENKRSEYLNEIMKIINWQPANERYAKIIDNKKNKP